MQNHSLTFHIGAHGNVSRYLNKIMSLNKDFLRTDGTLYFSNKEYKQANIICAQNVDGNSYSDNDRELFLDLLVDEDKFERLIFSFDAFISSRKTAVGESCLYPSLDKKLHLLRQQFLGTRIELVLGIESLTSFPTTLFNEIDVNAGLLLSSETYRNLTWTDVVARLFEAWPEIEVTVFLVEDAFLYWPRIVQKMLGLEAEDIFKLKGIFGYPLDQIKTEDRRAFLRPMRKNAPRSFEEYEERVRPFISADQILKPSSNEFPQLGWDHEFLYDLAKNYEEDVEKLSAFEGVSLI